jgi:DNA-binding beta-propeller fold protein YncE
VVVITKWGSSGASNGQFISPLGVAIDSSGKVYVADSGNNRIQKFGDTTTTTTEAGRS